MEQYGSQERLLAEDKPPWNNLPRDWKTFFIKILRGEKKTTTEPQLNYNAAESEGGQKKSIRKAK